MKTKITMRQGKAMGTISAGYCSIQNLLHYQEPFAYSQGTYGWNCDYYNINGTIIATGYRTPNLPRPDYDTIKEYDNKAERIIYSFDDAVKGGSRRNTVNELLNEFIEKIAK